MSQPYKSGRQQNLNLGITSVTENRTVLQTIGKVGIGTTNAQNHSLFVVGTTNITGDINVGGASTFVGVGTFNNDLYVANQLYVGGVSITGGATVGADIVTRNLLASGISTFNGFVDANGGLDVTGHTELDNLNVSGIATINNLNVQTGFDVYDTQAVFHNDVRIAGNLSIGGTATSIFAQDLRVFDKEITLGITTNAFGQDISTDDTANHGGISIASTVGSPLVDLSLVGYSTLPATYKQLMWVAANSYGIGTTDAWMFNYAVGIGSTLVPNGVRFAVKEIQFTDNSINTPNISVAQNLNVSGVSTLSGITTTGGNLYVGNDLYVADDIFADEINSRNAVLSGNLSVVGVSTFTGLLDANGGIDVTGQTELDNVNISGVTTFVGFVDANGGADISGQVTLTNLEVTGVSTFNGLLDANGGATIDNIRIGVANDNTIDTSTGNLTLDSNAGTVNITDQLNVSGIVTFQSNVYLGNDDKIILGDGRNLEIFSGGSNSIIDQVGTGDLILRTTSLGDDIILRAKDDVFIQVAESENAITCNSDGAVELYYDNTKEFETTGYGATVFGILQSQGLQVSGISTISVNSSTDALRINQLGTGNALVVEDETNPDSTPFVVTGLGTVGIGITNPTIKLTVNGGLDSSNRQVRFVNPGSGDLYIKHANLVSSIESASSVELALGGNGAEVVRIKSTGVGIGITNPTSKLSVVGNVLVSGISTFIGNGTTAGPAIFAQRDSGNNAGIKLYGTSGGNWVYSESTSSNPKPLIFDSSQSENILFRIAGSTKLYIQPTGELLVGTATSTGTASQLLQVNSGGYFNGSVGIGTTNPTSKLSVVGDVLVSGVSTLATLHAPKLTYNGSDFGAAGFIAKADGSGGWTWVEAPGLFSVNNILNGFIVKDEGTVVGTAGSITTLDFRGDNIVATADPQPNGIATVRLSDTPSFLSLAVTSGITTLGVTTATSLFSNQLSVSGLSTFIGVGTFGSDLYVGGNLYIKDDLVFDEATVRNINVTGVSTLGTASATTLNVSGISTVGLLNVGVGGTIITTTNTTRVGINSIAPNYTLDVNGDINFNGLLYQNNSPFIASRWSAGLGDDIYRLNGDVGIGTTNPQYTLEVSGNTRISGITSVTNLEIYGTVSAGTTTGANGQYLKSTGVGVTWADFPTLRTTGITTATNGQTTFSFSYSVGFLDVFVNGVKLTASEYIANNGSSIVLTSPAFANDIVEYIGYNTISTSGGGGGGSGASVLNDLTDVTLTSPAAGETLVYDGTQWINDYTVTATTSTTSQTTIHSLSSSTYRSVEYTIQATQGLKYHLTKILVVHDGLIAYNTEYGTVFTIDSLGTFDVDISGGNIRLLVTPSAATTTNYKIKFTAIKV